MLKPLLTTALLLAAVPAFADDKPVAPSTRVVTSDLDLTTAKGQSVLDRRLNAAVDLVCGTDDAPRTGIISRSNPCRNAAASAAKAQRDALIAAVKARRAAAADAGK